MHELEKLTARQLRKLVDTGGLAVVMPYGSLEHHGGHLPLGADAILADAVGTQVAQRLGAVLAPTMRVGDSARHRELFGTLSLTAATLTAVAVEQGQGLARQGFASLVLVSTHGGNRKALDAAVRELNASLHGTATVCAPRGDVGPGPGSYSGSWLTSVMLALRPDLVHLEHADADLKGELRDANATLGREHIERFVASAVTAAHTQ